MAPVGKREQFPPIPNTRLRVHRYLTTYPPILPQKVALMENIVLIVLLLIALALIAVVLMQRSEGGGLGMGGGGGVMTGRSAATALTKLTWILGAAFMAASLVMTIMAAQNSTGGSVVDRLGVTPPAADESVVPPPATDLLPPSSDDTAPLLPRAD